MTSRAVNRVNREAGPKVAGPKVADPIKAADRSTPVLRNKVARRRVKAAPAAGLAMSVAGMVVLLPEHDHKVPARAAPRSPSPNRSFQSPMP